MAAVAGLRMNGWLIAALAGLLGGGACRTARLRPPIDLGGYASHLPLPAEIATPPAIVRVHVPQGWRSDAPLLNHGVILRETNLSFRDDPRGAIRRGDIAMAVVPLQSLGTNVVIIVVSQPGVLSRDPALALAIFASCRFREPASLVLSNVETATVNNFSSEPTLTQ